jgi:tetratricopeptide (TPR) repeat protein
VQGFDATHPSFAALRWMIAAVLQERDAPALPATNASQLIGKSYYLQSTYDLEGALAAAQKATERSPQFGFAWARVAELQFSFGRNRAAQAALKRALELSPRNAQAHALSGFILLGQNKASQASATFERALEIDTRLANAWLGRGLAKFQQGRRDEGRADIQTATAMEPNRWLLRSYLGKAYTANPKLIEEAFDEFRLGREMDPRDPTPWLYSALLNHQEHRIGEAITDLEQSMALNDNRQVYRSRLLLDQDLAVRSAGLAPIYQRAGMEDVSLREASRAVSYDYANYSAHLFLANSYDAFRDPTRFNLRYETVWFNELLLANFLAPVGAGALSQNISQQEYFRLFEGKPVGLVTDTRYRSDDQYRELVSHFGTFGRTSYSLDLDYQHNAGVRPNNDLDRIEWYTTIKHQLTAQDTLLLLTKYQDFDSGDNHQYYNPADARPHFRFEEEQKPVTIGGYHREWSPGIHTLVLGGRLENDQRFADRTAPQWVLFRPTRTNSVGLIDDVGLDWEYRNRWEIFTAELQQLWDNPFHTLIAGGRWQGGDFDTQSRMTNPTIYTGWPNPPEAARVREPFERASGYIYETLKLPTNLRLTGGLTYEHITYPDNTRTPPISAGQSTRERFNPKASAVWDVATNITIRTAYARSLGGVSADESYRLEPTQLAGFGQDFRTLIPEAFAGSVSAPDHEIAAAALDVQFRTRTYLGVQGGILQSEVRRNVGVFEFIANPVPSVIEPSTTRQDLDYEEKFAGITINQLITDQWAVSVQYLFVRSELTRAHPDLRDAVDSLDSTNRAEMHRINLGLLFNHPSGFFARAEGQWYIQQNLGTANIGGITEKDLPDESYPQVNLFVGYRLPRQRGDITLGVMNLTDEDYRLNPISPYYEMPRERVFYAQLRLRF